MFSVLHVCSYVAAVIAFLFVTLSLASGLLYVAELVEEHSRLAKLIGQRTIYIVIGLHLLFCVFDKLPIHLTAFGIVCHLVYLQNFSKTWPFISLSSLKFIASCLLVILDHFAWFFYFAERARETASVSSRRPGYRSGSQWDPQRYGHSGRYAGMRELSFMDVATFFGVCVWLVPFFLFLSLSANDNVLPSLGETTPHIKTTAASEQNSPNSGPTQFASGPPPNLSIRTQAVTQRSSILKVALDPLISLIPRIGSAKFRSSRSQRDGLIASPHPSAPPSPSAYGGPSSPAYFGNAGPFSAATTNGTSAYDSASLSPQTPFNNRFGDYANMRGAAASPQLRSPPVPKRSATSPAGGLPGANGIPHISPSRTPGATEASLPSLPPSATYQPQEEVVVSNIARSTSPFAPPGQGASGLISRRRNA